MGEQCNMCAKDGMLERLTDRGDKKYCADCLHSELSEFRYMVSITCETQEEADRVVSERLAHDEDYGFEYTLVYGQVTY